MLAISQTNEPERAPDGKIVPLNGKVNVRLANKTNDRLFYQVVGQTNRGTVELILDETNDLGLDKRSLTIRNDGALFLR